MKQTRKNPFAPATAYNGPTKSFETHADSEVNEDPSFSDFSTGSNHFNQPPAFEPNKAKNPFSTPQKGFDTRGGSNYSQASEPNEFNSFDGFSNSGWTHGGNVQANPTIRVFEEPKTNFEKQNYTNSNFEGNLGTGYAESQITDDLNEPPLLEGKLQLLAL